VLHHHTYDGRQKCKRAFCRMKERGERERMTERERERERIAKG
jgi:hypothetical protein